MKLSYSIALFLPPLLSNLETSRSKTTGDTENPRLKSASLSSFVSILPLLSLSNLSNMLWKNQTQHHTVYINSIKDLTKPLSFYKLPSNSEDCRKVK